MAGTVPAPSGGTLELTGGGEAGLDKTPAGSFTGGGRDIFLDTPAGRETSSVLDSTGGVNTSGSPRGGIAFDIIDAPAAPTVSASDLNTSGSPAGGIASDTAGLLDTASGGLGSFVNSNILGGSSASGTDALGNPQATTGTAGLFDTLASEFQRWGIFAVGAIMLGIGFYSVTKGQDVLQVARHAGSRVRAAA